MVSDPPSTAPAPTGPPEDAPPERASRSQTGATPNRPVETTLRRELLAILVLYGFVSILPLWIGSCSGL